MSNLVKFLILICLNFASNIFVHNELAYVRNSLVFKLRGAELFVYVSFYRIEELLVMILIELAGLEF